jgi:hypothetical protein
LPRSLHGLRAEPAISQHDVSFGRINLDANAKSEVGSHQRPDAGLSSVRGHEALRRCGFARPQPGRSTEMTRLALPFAAPDLSAFARALGRALKARHAEQAQPPGHNELLNLIAAAAGHRSYQALRASAAAAADAAARKPRLLPPPAGGKPPAAAEAAAPSLSDNARRALGQFDADGRLVRWPVKFTVQRLVIWVLRIDSFAVTSLSPAKKISA